MELVKSINRADFLALMFEAFDLAFKSQLRHHVSLFHGVEIVPLKWQEVNRATACPTYGFEGVIAPVYEYEDWVEFDVKSGDTIQKARDLGFSAAVCYNSVASNAIRTLGHRHVTDLTLDNLKFRSVVQDGGMEYDREGKGWHAFRFYFASY